MKKRCLVFLICFVFFVSGCGIVFSQDNEDVASYYGEDIGFTADICRSLGVLEGFGDEYFELDRELTKAEMCLLLTQIINMRSVYNENYNGEDVFSDVPSSHWAAGCISLMKNLGVINGNGLDKFYPENKVSANEAVKMLVASLGYDVVAKSSGGYPTGYHVVGTKLGILTGVTFSDNVTFADVICMAYNSFDVPLVRALSADGETQYSVDPDNYDTILTIRNIYYDEGQITANEYSSLVPGIGECSENEIIINRNTYGTGNTDISGKLGHTAEIYYKESGGKRTVIDYIINDEKFVLINSKNIISYGLDYINYENNGKEEKATLADGAVFICNGVAEHADKKLLDIKSGDITLINSGTSGKSSGYDVVIINSYAHMYVDSVSSDDIIYFRNPYLDGAASLDISEAEIYKDSKPALASDILSGDTVAILKSLNSEKIVVEVISQSVYGTVAEYSNGDSLIIDSKSYDISSEFSAYGNKIIQPGLSGTFYLDKFGDVFYYMQTEPQTRYAFSFGIKSDAMNDSVQLKLLTADSAVEIFELAKSVEVLNADGIWGKSVNIAKDKAEDFFGPALRDILFVYDINSRNEINYIELPVAGDIVNDIDGISLDYTLETTERTAYGRIGQLYMNKLTCGFVISKKGDSYDEKNSYVKPGGDFDSGGYYGSADNPIYFYDVSKAGVAGAVLDFRGGKATVLTEGEWPLLLADSVSMALDENGDEITVLKGIMSNSESRWQVGEDASAVTDSLKSISDIDTGDILLMEKNQTGEISVYDVIYDNQNPTEGKLIAAGYGYAAVSASDTTVYRGYIYWLDSQNIRLCYDGNSYITFDMPGECMVYVYDSKRNDIYIGDMSDIVYSEMNDYTANSKVVLKANRNAVDTIIVYK